jgi:hypothetical protein
VSVAALMRAVNSSHEAYSVYSIQLHSVELLKVLSNLWLAHLLGSSKGKDVIVHSLVRSLQNEELLHKSHGRSDFRWLTSPWNLRG